MQLSEMKVVTPSSLAEALQILAEHGEGARPLAGATDAMVRVKEGYFRTPVWVEIRRLPELTRAAESGGMVEVGAAMPYCQILRNEMLRRCAPLLLEAVRDVGSVQIRAMGTIGGNLGTASPAGDTLPALYALEAQVRLVSARGERLVGIEEFVLGPGQTLRRPDELIASVVFAAQPEGELSSWQKLGLRGAQAISIASLAMRLHSNGPGTAAFARLAYGAVGPTVLRARRCEEMIVQAGQLDAERLAAIAAAAAAEVRPISDVRAGAEYRREMAGALLCRGLTGLLGGGDGG